MLPLVVLAADYAGTLEVAERTEARARATQQPSTPGSASLVGGVDLFAQPQLRAHVDDRRWELTLGYMPSLTLSDLEANVSPLILHTGSAGVRWHDRSVRVTLSEDATYGTFNSANLVAPTAPTTPAQLSNAPTAAPAGPAAAIQPTPAPTTITLLATRTALSTSAQTDRRTLLSAGIAYLDTGGADASSRPLLPENYGPRADASLSYSVSRRDQLVTSAFGQAATFTGVTCTTTGAVAVNPLPGTAATPGVAPSTCAAEDEFAHLDEAVNHAIARTAMFSFGLGASVARSRANGDVSRTVLYPSGAISFRYGSPQRMGFVLGLTGTLEPFIDPQRGTLSNRAQANVTLGQPFSRVITLHLSAGGAEPIPADPLAATILFGDISLAVLADQAVALDVGARGMWQKGDLLGEFFSVFGYVAVTLTAPKLRF
jgi:hypothetical protein